MMDRPLVSVVQFPGSNCEYETARAVEAHGMAARIVRWNSLSELEDARAVILPGGFSYQDRVRAGAVAAKERIMDAVVDMASRGIPVLGICNGAQILVESGLVPGWEPGRIQAALGANMIHGRSGYLSRWVHLRANPSAARRSIWLSKLDQIPVAVPIAHAEGRFVFSSDQLDRASRSLALEYCRFDGSSAEGYPDNPNGSMLNMAGIMSDDGGVLAMMPHPERCCWLWQVPPALRGYWGKLRRREHHRPGLLQARGPGSRFFAALAEGLGVVHE